jgi:hypothetical protein
MIRYTEGALHPGIYARLTDAQIWSIYFRRRDPDGKLYRRRKPQRDDSRPVISPDMLDIPGEAYEIWPDADPGFVSMFWSVWRVRRRKSEEETMERWREYVDREVYKGRGGRGGRR